MGVAGDRRVHPDLEAGPVRAHPREPERGRDVDVGGEAPRPLAGGAVEHAGGLADGVHVDSLVEEPGHPVEPGRGLAGDHAHLLHLAERGCLDRVEAEEGSARDEDPPAALGRQIHVVEVVEERAHAHADEGAARFEGGAGDLRERRGGRALHDDVGELRQLCDRTHGGYGPEIRAARAGPLEVPGRHRGEGEPGNGARVDGARHFETDCSESRDGDSTRAGVGDGRRVGGGHDDFMGELFRKRL